MLIQFKRIMLLSIIKDNRWIHRPISVLKRMSNESLSDYWERETNRLEKAYGLPGMYVIVPHPVFYTKD